jgi:hypothetical protein
MHDAWQEIIGVYDGELSAALCGSYIHALCFETRAKCIPMRDSRNKDDALAARQRGSREAADGTIEELLILIKLDDVIPGRRVGQETRPRLDHERGISFVL